MTKFSKLESLLCGVVLVSALAACSNSPNDPDSPAPITAPTYFQRIYVVDSTANSVRLCELDEEGDALLCSDSGNSGAAFDNPNRVVFNSARTFAYVSNFDSDAISVCPVNAHGNFGTCVNTAFGGDGPSSVAINNDNSFLYITSSTDNSIYQCAIGLDGSLSGCADSGPGATFSSPKAISLNPQGTYAYITHAGDIDICAINSSTGSLSGCGLYASLNVPQASTFNPTGDRLYVADSGNNSINKCEVSLADGTISGCSALVLTDAALTGPRSIKLSDNGEVAFISDVNRIVICPVEDSDGSFGTCLSVNEDFQAANGMDFITPRKRIFFAFGTNGGFGGITGADATCANADENPNDGAEFKALIAGDTRHACTTADCSVGGATENLDWVLAAQTQYYRAGEGTLIGKTTNAGIFAFPLTNPMTADTRSAWTGMDTDWTQGTADNCLNWSTSSELESAGAGLTDQADASILFTGNYSCSLALGLYCVEQ